jgi:hypothetical protein
VDLDNLTDAGIRRDAGYKSMNPTKENGKRKKDQVFVLQWRASLNGLHKESIFSSAGKSGQRPPPLGGF